ncbi:MAG: DoxX family protein [Pseudorhodoplanes sp.]
MPVLFTVGRVALVLIFIVSGALKLMDISGTAAFIATKVSIPAAGADLATQIETALGMPWSKLLAIVVGLVEVLGGVMIVFNIGTRFAAIVLILFTLTATFYFHDFWNMADMAKVDNANHAMKNLSLVGGLLILFVLTSWRAHAIEESADTDHY